MRLDIHIKYLDQIVKQIPVSATQYKAFKQGIQYPDLPCGKYEVSSAKSPPSVTLKTRDICSWLNYVVHSTGESAFNEIHTSHIGHNAIVHAMTPYVHKTVEEIQTSILELIELFFYLAVFGESSPATPSAPAPDPFWIGVVLHTLMDACSPAHVIRKLMLGTEKSNITRKLLEYANNEAHVLPQDEVIDRLTVDLPFQKERLEDIDNAEIYHYYLIMKHQAIYMNRLNSMKRKPSRRLRPDDMYAIIDFQNFAKQSTLFHVLRDSKSQVEHFSLETILIEACTFVVQLYLDTIQARSLPPKRFKATLKKLTSTLKAGVLRVHPAFAHLISGMHLDASALR
jgi:hypothetical protein